MENDEREEQKEEEDQIVNPWKVEAKEGGKIDYDKLIDKFGCQRIDESLIVASNVSPLAFLMSSFAAASFSLTVNHRDFNDILDAYERGGNFYLYTGRGPSSDGLHVDHLLPFMFTNAFYRNMVKVSKCVTFNKDPYFRMTRYVAPRIGYQKPALIESLFFPALLGETGKMFSCDPNSAIYVTDSAKDIENKVNKHVFSGGQESMDTHRIYGANLEVDIPIKYLGFFLEDDAELEHIRKEYAAGRMLTGEVKKRLIEVLTELVERHRRARAAVTDEMVDAFTTSQYV